MTRQEHHVRQMKWFEELGKYGKAQIEPSVRIRKAEVFPDVYAEIDGKKYIIEIGDVDDQRKEALLELYAENNSDLVFVHERYGEDKIEQTLETIKEYQDSDECTERQIQQMEMEKQRTALLKRRSLAFWGVFLGFFVWVLSFALALSSASKEYQNGHPEIGGLFVLFFFLFPILGYIYLPKFVRVN